MPHAFKMPMHSSLACPCNLLECWLLTYSMVQQRAGHTAQQRQDVHGASASGTYDAMVASLWGSVEGALHLSDGGLPQLSEIRTEHQDWVRDGLRLRRCAGLLGRQMCVHEFAAQMCDGPELRVRM